MRLTLAWSCGKRPVFNKHYLVPSHRSLVEHERRRVTKLSSPQVPINPPLCFTLQRNVSVLRTRQQLTDTLKCARIKVNRARTNMIVIDSRHKWLKREQQNTLPFPGFINTTPWRNPLENEEKWRHVVCQITELKATHLNKLRNNGERAWEYVMLAAF